MVNFLLGVAFTSLCMIIGWAAWPSWRDATRFIRHNEVEFSSAPEHVVDEPKDPARARISKARMDSNTLIRRPVRRYTPDEDAADPFRK